MKSHQKNSATNYNFTISLNHAGRDIPIQAQLKEARDGGKLSGQFIACYRPETMDELKAIIAKHGEDYILSAFTYGTSLNRKSPSIMSGTIADKAAMDWLLDGIGSSNEERKNVCVELLAKKSTSTLDLWLVRVKDAMRDEQSQSGKLSQEDILDSNGQPKVEYVQDLFESNVQ